LLCNYTRFLSKITAINFETYLKGFKFEQFFSIQGGFLDGLTLAFINNKNITIIIQAESEKPILRVGKTIRQVKNEKDKYFINCINYFFN